MKTSFAYRSCNDTSHSFATLFFEFDVILSPPFQLRPPLFRSSQTISARLNFCNSFQQLQLPTALKVVPSLPPHLNSFHFFSAFLNSPQRLSPRLHPSQVFSIRFNSSSTHLLLRSPHLTSFAAHLNSSHLLSETMLTQRAMPGRSDLYIFSTQLK